MMPKKKILIFCKSEVHAGQLSYVLSVRGNYAPTVIADASAILWMIQNGSVFDLLLAELEPGTCEANDLALRIKEISSLPVIIFSRTGSSFDRASHADYFIPEYHCNSEEILTRVGIMVRRKRGPKVCKEESRPISVAEVVA